MKFSLQTDELFELQKAIIDEMQNKDATSVSHDWMSMKAKQLKDGTVGFLSGEERMKIDVKDKVFGDWTAI